MDKTLFNVESFDVISATIAEIRSLRLGYITNFFADLSRLSSWISKGDCLAERVNNSFFIIKRSDLFWNVYYCSSSLADLTDDLKIFQKKHTGQTMVFDIVGRDDQCQETMKVFQESGSKLATKLVRMTRLLDIDTVSPDYENSFVSYANEKDVLEIHSLLHRFFIERFEQIPYFEELIDYSHKKQILVCKEDEKMAGFLIFDHNPSTLYLRYWFTLPEFRNRGVGSRLFHSFIEEGKGTRRQLLWVIQTNENAIKRYKHYGFTEENMYDYIMQFN